MAEDTGRTRTLRSSLSIRRKKLENYQAEKRLNERLSKPTLVQFQITDDDIGATPIATQGQVTKRSTWPYTEQHPGPGTHSFDVVPTLTRTPWELERSKRPTSGNSRTVHRPSTSSRKFEQLPRETILRILDQVKSLNSSGYALNIPSYHNDLRTFCLVNKRWSWVAREYLYREIWLPGGNEQQNRSFLQLRKHGSRLKLLQRTLEESASISEMVHILRVTEKLAYELELEPSTDRPMSKDSAMEALRVIILNSPNLEHVSGYALMTLDYNARIFEALSLCRVLKSHTWRLPPSDVTLSTPYLRKYQVNWHQLETLVIWQPIDGRGVGVGVISAAIQRLPSLKHLLLRGLSPTDFHNGSLLTLPPLRSLRLEEVHGVTDQGIEQLSYTRLAMSLEKLVLAGLELTSLQSLQTLLANLIHLRSFCLFQNTSPEMPPWFSVRSNSFSIASTSIRFLHWDVLARESIAVTILANSIAAGKFPSLQRVTVPCDDDGLIQALCRPISLEPITDHDTVLLKEWEQSPSYKRSLRASQIQAQLRIRREKKQPALKVVVQDEESIQQTHVIGSYLGNLASDIEYSLEPAIAGTTSALARIEDVLLPRKQQAKDDLAKAEEVILDLDVLF